MKDYIWHPCTQMKDHEIFPLIMADRAEGIYIYDEAGNAYMDVISSWWCNLLGHGNPRLNRAVERQLKKMEHIIFAGFTHRPAEELCERLTAVLPEGLEKFYFVDNGSSAVEVAMKMSFQYHHQNGKPEKQRFLTLDGGYHGETLGALAAGGMDRYSEMFRPLLAETVHVKGPDCWRCPYGKQRESCTAECAKIAEKAFAKYGKEAAAFLLEPILQGAAGMRIYSPKYLKKIRALCDAYDVHLIADEIAAGFGRTGKLFACEHAGISPDFMCLSKGLTGGYLPMAITVTTKRIYDGFYGDYSEGRAFLHSTTYGGHPMACAAGVEVLRIFEEEQILERMESDYLNRALRQALEGHPNVGEIRSIGLINAIELTADRQRKTPFEPRARIGWRIGREAIRRGLLLRPIGDIPYFNPPLTMTKRDIDKAVEICRASIEAVLGNRIRSDS